MPWVNKMNRRFFATRENGIPWNKCKNAWTLDVGVCQSILTERADVRERA
jgi:hypothetical protein